LRLPPNLSPVVRTPARGGSNYRNADVTRLPQRVAGAKILPQPPLPPGMLRPFTHRQLRDQMRSSAASSTPACLFLIIKGHRNSRRTLPISRTTPPR